MLCEIRMFSRWSHISQTSALAATSLVSSAELQQYPASRPVFFAMGTDFGRFLTFSRSVFSIVKGGLLCAGMAGEEISAEAVMRVDGIEDGPGTGWELCAGMVGEEISAEAVTRVDGIEDGPGTGRECDTESADVDNVDMLISAVSWPRK